MSHERASVCVRGCVFEQCVSLNAVRGTEQQTVEHIRKGLSAD